MGANGPIPVTREASRSCFLSYEDMQMAKRKACPRLFRYTRALQISRYVK
jgi:hypothetical protein